MPGEELHPDLAAIFAAGDALLPDDVLADATPATTDEIDGGGDAVGGLNASRSRSLGQLAVGGEWGLQVLLTEAYRHALDKARQAEAAPHHPPRPSVNAAPDAAGGTGVQDDDGAGSEVKELVAPTQRATVALGDGISWGRGTDSSSTTSLKSEVGRFPALGPAQIPARDHQHQHHHHHRRRCPHHHLHRHRHHHLHRRRRRYHHTQRALIHPLISRVFR
jgi:hypothetical protein